MARLHCFLLEGATFGEAGLLLMSWWYLALLLQGIDHYGGNLFILIIFSF
jgi:hypothetical protein